MFLKKFLMTGFKLWTSDPGSNRSANWATTTTPSSVARLGYFWKVLETYSLTKVTHILGNFLCYFKNISLCVKTALGHFWATLVKIGLLLILSSRHTDHEPACFVSFVLPLKLNVPGSRYWAIEYCLKLGSLNWTSLTHLSYLSSEKDVKS